MNINVGEQTSKYIEDFINFFKKNCILKKINFEELNYKKIHAGGVTINDSYNWHTNKYPNNKKCINILDNDNSKKEFEYSLIYKQYSESCIKYFLCLDKINSIIKDKKSLYLNNKFFYKKVYENNNKKFYYLNFFKFLQEFNVIKFTKGEYEKKINSRCTYVNLFLLLNNLNESTDSILFKADNKEINLNTMNNNVYCVFKQDCTFNINSTADIYMAHFIFEFADINL